MTDATPPSAAGGESFGDYVLLRKIAQGGMAEVFLAKRRGVEGFEKTVAIKRILPELSWNREFVTMFINEAKIAARLSHPNIVQIFDFGKIESYYFIAMEFIAGENLRTVLQRADEKRLPMLPGLAALIIARACAGLEHAHRKTDESGKPMRIVHRDISPQNVLVSYEGEVKVVDFGIAKAVAENPEATRGVLKGKLAYLSPEQVGGENLDARSDLFSIGLVFYELLTGGKLFDRHDPGEILDAIVRVDSEEVSRSIPNLHKRLREVLQRSLHVTPSGRYASAGEMQQALEDYLREQGDPGGTMQLTNFMRILFDEKAGEATVMRLRSRLLEPSKAAGWSSTSGRGTGARLVAAVGGAVAGVVVVAFAAPLLKPELSPGLPERPAAPAAAPSESSGKPSAASSDDDGAGDLELAGQALAANQPGKAIAAFEHAFAAAPKLRERNAPNYARALLEDARAKFDTDSNAAAARLRAAIQADPDLFDAHFLLAKIYARKSDPASAAREYQEAIRINPESADAYFNLGFIHFSQRRYPEALRQYEKVIELRPPYLADVFYNLSACYEQMKRKPEAIEALRRGLEAVPENELLKQRLKQLGG